VVTTAAPVPQQELDPAGLELQSEILADGKVTREEYEQAYQGWKTCMEERGLLSATFEIQPTGGAATEYGSPDPNAGEAEDAACRASYVDRVDEALQP